MKSKAPIKKVLKKNLPDGRLLYFLKAIRLHAQIRRKICKARFYFVYLRLRELQFPQNGLVRNCVLAVFSVVFARQQVFENGKTNRIF